MKGFNDPSLHLFWLSSRALGIVAIVLLGISMIVGLLMSSGRLRKPGLTTKLRNSHEALALSACLAIAAHGLLLLGDSYLKPGLVGITVPFTMSVDPIWNGLGVIAGWLALLFTLSFYVRKQIGTKTWRKLHRFTVVAFGLALIHTLGAGTDVGEWWMVVTLVAVTAPIVLLIALKLLPKKAATKRNAAPKNRPHAVAVTSSSAEFTSATPTPPRRRPIDPNRFSDRAVSGRERVAQGSRDSTG